MPCVLVVFCIFFAIITSNEKANLTQKFVHTILRVNMTCTINLKEFKYMLLEKQYIDSMNKEKWCTWVKMR